MTNTALAAVASLGMAALMAGCASHGPAPAAAPSPIQSQAQAPAPDMLCNAQPAQAAVGQSSTASVVESARARSGARMVRILRPGQMVTKEFDTQRLNLEVDANGRILAVRCG
ncbi:MAG: I78 family peptidase inhibitor [Acidovorax sp.]|uniref:I78 family peptidase inhibitor n=1 Tax=Acidovorax sp. TaxID=1872122 RepID=UPI0022CA493B|nr:I78 family peptidase inhibitor [Acidovorax sp.]MCZ8218735.1 I78 family peptidase inhibitor [Acidovorax sp.]